MLKGTRVYQSVFNRVVAMLVKEHRTYEQRFPNDPDELKNTLRPGDVVLVEGSQRISQIIKYLTQSSWSHAALYVGDRLITRGGKTARDLRDEFRGDADALVIEANVETGVTAVPISKYTEHNIRVCRPLNLRPGDLNTVIETVMSQLGTHYDVSHIMDLLRYFFPFGLPWRRATRSQVVMRARMSQEVICSSQIAMAFQKVRYPILPDITEYDRAAEFVPSRFSIRMFRRRPAYSSIFSKGVFTPCDPLLVTPRDFDLSPYFEIVKLGSSERREFDYKKMKWSAEPAAPPAPPAAQPEVPAPLPTSIDPPQPTATAMPRTATTEKIPS